MNMAALIENDMDQWIEIRPGEWVQLGSWLSQLVRGVGPLAPVVSAIPVVGTAYSAITALTSGNRPAATAPIVQQTSPQPQAPATGEKKTEANVWPWVIGGGLVLVGGTWLVARNMRKKNTRRRR